MAEQGYNNPTSRNSSTAATIPAKISPSGSNKMGADGASQPTAKAKNVNMGSDSDSSLSIKNGKI